MRKEYSRTKLSEKKKIIMDDTLDWLRRMTAAITAMSEGCTEVKACRDNDIDQMSFRAFLGREKLGYHNRLDAIDPADGLNIVGIPHFSDYFLSWQERLWLAIFAERDFTRIPPDIDEAFDDVLSEFSERERKIIHLRYDEGMTLEESGQELGITRNRVLQIENDILRKLRNPKRSKRLLVGGSFYQKIEEQRKKLNEAEGNERFKELRERTEKALITNDVKTLLELKNVIDAKLSSMNQEDVNSVSEWYDFWETDISELGLTIRSYNGLRRAGFKTYGDLRELSTSKLIWVRNIGEVSRKDIIEKCKKIGIEVIDDINNPEN